MSAFRYAVANIRKLHKRKESSAEGLPVVQPAQRESVVTISIRKPAEGPLRFVSPQEDEFAQWRQRLGQPVKPPYAPGQRY